MHTSVISAAGQRMVNLIAGSGSDFAGLCPAPLTSHRAWTSMVRYIFESEVALQRLHDLMEKATAAREWVSIGMDATSKLVCKTIGQATPTSTSSVTEVQARSHEDAEYWLVTMVGSTGAVGALELVHREKSAAYVQALRLNLTPSQLDQVGPGCKA